MVLLCMSVPINERRKLITKLFLNRDYEGLEKLGLEKIGEGKGYDCGNHVLNALNIPQTANNLQLLRNLPNLDSGDLVFYGIGSGPRFDVKHYGIFRGNKVESKWEHGPVFLHDLFDVPDYFGTEVMFGNSMELRNKMFESQFGQIPDEDYY